MSDIQLLKEKVRDLKVLFVDDEKDVRNGTGIFLKKFFDSVTICSDGEEGLKKFSDEKDFDVVITDILMPVMDGVEMTQKIRKINSDVFVIFLTASRSVDDIDDKLSDITLQKPLSFEDMILVMNQLGELK